MKEKTIKLSVLVEVMKDFEDRQKVVCFEKNEKEDKKFFKTIHHVVSYENMWNSLKKQLIKKVKTQSINNTTEKE